jgi:hypothetical protein
MSARAGCQQVCGYTTHDVLCCCLLPAAPAEVGHNMGLSHDGSPTNGYYEGQGDWAPVSIKLASTIVHAAQALL